MKLFLMSSILLASLVTFATDTSGGPYKSVHSEGGVQQYGYKSECAGNCPDLESNNQINLHTRHDDGRSTNPDPAATSDGQTGKKRSGTQ